MSTVTTDAWVVHPAPLKLRSEPNKSVVTTEAWVIDSAPDDAHELEPAELRKETYSFTNITEYEVLAEPIYGCWEGNMTHAIQRSPVDVCRQRGEKKIVIGNAGVVRILKIGSSVTNVKEGDLCLFAAVGTTDQFGYLIKVVGYDARDTIGLLAKRIKLNQNQVIPLPKDSKLSPQQWAAFSLRYTTAWANWKVAYGCWRLQMPEDLQPVPFVWGWGGGVTLAELTLAKYFGCQVSMMASDDDRLKLIQGLGIKAIDRRQFSHLDFDEKRVRTDSAYRRLYRESEKTFLQLVKEDTGGLGASIFIDNIGKPVFRATMKALARQGVVTTVGWKKGMDLSVIRATECINHHVHVFSHGARYFEGVASIAFAEQTGWAPPVTDVICSWDNIPQLAEDCGTDKNTDYFPLYQVNPL
jgi:NADPH:quinone reductase-like Zn-dependent oxidoreductase